MVNSGRTTYGPDASNPQGGVYAYHEVSQNAAGSPGFAGDQYSTAIDVQGQGYIPATQHGQPVEGSQCQAIANMFCTKLNVLLIFVPLGIHFGANVFWQFLTLNATIEEAFRKKQQRKLVLIVETAESDDQRTVAVWHIDPSLDRTVDVITIMPCSDLTPTEYSLEQHLQIQVMGISTFVLASLATVFMRQYNLLTQGFGLVAFLLCFVPAQRALDQTCQEAGQRLGYETV
ncbi:unnamed protein product [Symbiodinium sp. CCMP2592]|nr:unnamed protein product [Symbiodinium sp. CCMP2592]